MFGADAQTLACTVAYMPRYAWGFIIMSVNTLISAYLYSTKRTKQAVILNLCRSFLLDSVIIFAVPAVFGGNAVWLTMGIYEALARCSALCSCARRSAAASHFAETA